MKEKDETILHLLLHNNSTTFSYGMFLFSKIFSIENLIQRQDTKSEDLLLNFQKRTIAIPSDGIVL